MNCTRYTFNIRSLLRQVEKTSLFTLICLLGTGDFVSSCGQSRQAEVPGEYILWYDNPAEAWEDALPLANGRIGAMVFGYTDTERIQLNDDSLWPADTGWDMKG
jgi:alpha-L-fucosidase 2